jgi:hypothetical protein
VDVRLAVANQDVADPTLTVALENLEIQETLTVVPVEILEPVAREEEILTSAVPSKEKCA